MQASLVTKLKSLALVFILLFAALPSLVAAQGIPGIDNNISADLVAENAPVAGEEFTVALRFSPNEGWHGYWSNPGDAGFGMLLDWQLPEGWVAGKPQYPVPHSLELFELINHSYEEDYAVLVPISVPADAQISGIPTISVDAAWLACSDSKCVPEQGILTLRFPQDSAAHRAQFDMHRAAIPPLIDAAASFAYTPDRLRIAIPLPRSIDLTGAHIFLEERDVMDYAAEQNFIRDGDMVYVDIARGGFLEEPEAINGIIAFGEADAETGVTMGLRFNGAIGDLAVGDEDFASVAGAAQSGGNTPFWLLLGGALLGGLLLNLMPCVFPILSLKAISLVRAGESEAVARREGLAYTTGVVLACLAIGGLLLALRAAGEQVGWAFQLQSPLVVVTLMVLALMITANFAGVFELPSIAITRTGGRSSAFLTGLLAAFVATPCTGPFMAAALGAALLLPNVLALLLFAALGLGLALPFLALGFVPALRKILPKPGAWMEKFRRTMALPMGLTALALIWLVTRIGGKPFALMALVMIAGLLIGLVITGRLQKAGKMAWPAFGLIAAPFLLFGAFALPASFAPPSAESKKSLLEPIEYSEQALADARASGQPVFLWFTADWCVTCKVNESVAIEREATKAATDEAGVITMRGDWTRPDPEITRFLTEHGVAGVPLYLWYPAGDGGQGEQLPQILTPDILVEYAQGQSPS